MEQIMQNSKRMFAFSIFLIILVFSVLTDDVKAAKALIDGAGGGGSSVDTNQCATMNSRRLPGVPSIINLGGMTAFCLDESLITTIGTQYRLVGVSRNLKHKNAFGFYNHFTMLREYYYAQAQFYLWGYSKINAIGPIMDYLHGLGFTISEIKPGFNYDYDNISKVPYGYCPIVYLWEALNNPGSNQRLITCGKPKYLTKCEIKEPVLSCYTKGDKYYGLNGKEVTKEQYELECSKGIEKEEEVQPKKECPVPNTQPSGECEDQGRYIDPTFEELMNCDVNKEKYKEANQISETYCRAYCVEEVNTLFPGAGYTFKAGQYFTVGSSTLANTWGPISFTGVRTCKSFVDNGYTEGVNTTQFIKDYNSVALQEITAYNNAKNEERKQEAAQNATYSTYDKRCSSTTSRRCDRGRVSGSKCVESYIETPGHCANPEAEDGCGWVDDKWSTRVVGSSYCPSGYYSEGSICRQNRQYWGTWYYSNSYITYDNYGNSSTRWTRAGCSRDSGSPNWSAYYNAKSRRQSLELTLQKCNNFDIDYNLEPDVFLTYTSDVNYTIDSEKLGAAGYSQSNVVNGSAQGNINGSGNNTAPAYCTGSDCQLVHYECSGEKCTYGANKTSGIRVSGVNVKQKTSITHSYVEYNLETTKYQYISKIDGSVKESISSNSLGHYIDMGTNVIPISYTLVPEDYEISLNYSKIGHIVNDKGHFDEFVEEEGTYACTINIENDILCKDCNKGDNPIGLDVIYRPIQLGSQAVAFPSIDGDGRQPGDNWVGITDSGQSYVDAYITNNRGVADYEVYNLEPLYTIEMTPTLIRKIRAYNNSVGDYNDFNLTCTNGRQCYSSFIHSEFDEYIGGSCGNARNSDFDSCRN